MKTYTAAVDSTTCKVTPSDGAPSYLLDPRHDLMNHSPDGFAWGYHGSGPAQFALALLSDHLGRDVDRVTETHYQRLKQDLVAPARRDKPFVITTDKIQQWFEKETRS